MKYLDEHLETMLSERLQSENLSYFQRDFLSSILRQMNLKKSLSEKQTKTLNLVLEESDPKNFEIWEISKEEKDEIQMLSNLTKSYSNYYLYNFNIKMKNAFARLNDLCERIVQGRKVFKIDEKCLSTARILLDPKLRNLREPSFSSGDLCLFKKETCIVLSDIRVSAEGHIVYTIDTGGSQLEVLHSSLKKFKKKTSQ